MLDCVSTNAYECSGHGNCYDLKSLARLAAEETDDSTIVYGSDPNNAETWDATHISGCKCQPGWTGYDCSLHSCPIGIDPSTVWHERQNIVCRVKFGTISTSDTATISVDVKGTSKTVTLPANSGANTVRAALEGIEGLGKVKVTHRPQLPDSLCNGEVGDFT